MFSNRQDDNDDIISSLMNELGGGQQIQAQAQSGTTTTTTLSSGQLQRNIIANSNNTNDGDNDDSDEYHYYQRLLPELDGYPNFQRYVGDTEIWNPYVPSNSSYGGNAASHSAGADVVGGCCHHLLLPTNPQVEVIRRRAYEKFKQSCYQTLLEQTKKSNMNNSNNSKAGSNINNNVPSYCIPSNSIPSFLEKWHMDCKLQEYMYMRKKQQQHNESSSSSSSSLQPPLRQQRVLDSTVEIYRHYQVLLKHHHHQQQSNNNSNENSEIMWLDPILLSKRIVSETFTKAYREEVEKLFNKCHINNNNTTIDTNTSEFRRYQRQVKKLSKAVYKFTCEAIEYFCKELQVAASREAVQSSSYSSSVASSFSKHRKKHKKKKKGGGGNKLPKITLPMSSLHASSSGKGDGGSDDHNGELVTVTYAGLSFQIHPRHYEKLQRMFDRAYLKTRRRNHDNINPNFDNFEIALFCLLCRYDTLQGAGLQASVPGSVMDVLLQKFSCRIECFASPMNCRYESYHSIFGDVNDIDSLFGSVGNLFGKETNTTTLSHRCNRSDDSDDDNVITEDIGGGDGCCYQANPPFCERVISELCSKIRSSIITSKEGCIPGAPIMFVVIVPVWSDSRAYQQLVTLLHELHGDDEVGSSERNPHHMILPQGKHWYAEGTQYRRSKSFRVASFDTSIFFYQNEKAQRKWPLIQQTLDDLEAAFTTDPRSGTFTVRAPQPQAVKKQQRATTIRQTTEQDAVKRSTIVEPESNHNNKKQKKTFKKTMEGSSSTKGLRSSNGTPAATAAAAATRSDDNDNKSSSRKKRKIGNTSDGGLGSKNNKTTKKKKKQRMNIMKDAKVEAKAQLDLLKSLGL